jgi:hypothetical protein
MSQEFEPWYKEFSKTSRDQRLFLAAQFTQTPVMSAIGLMTVLKSRANDADPRGQFVVCANDLKSWDWMIGGAGSSSALIEQFVAFKLLERLGDETLYVARWDDEQPKLTKPMTETERKRDYRARKDAGLVTPKVHKSVDVPEVSHDVPDTVGQVRDMSGQVGTGHDASRKNVTERDAEVAPPVKAEPETIGKKSVAGQTYKTAKKKTLSGELLAQFDQLWATFNYKQGKAEAADAFLEIEGRASIWDQIIAGAKAEAVDRPNKLAANKTPKMLQGWLTLKRWENEISPQQSPVRDGGDIPEISEEQLDLLLLETPTHFGFDPIHIN